VNWIARVAFEDLPARVKDHLAVGVGIESRDIHLDAVVDRDFPSLWQLQHFGGIEFVQCGHHRFGF